MAEREESFCDCWECYRRSRPGLARQAEKRSEELLAAVLPDVEWKRYQEKRSVRVYDSRAMDGYYSIVCTKTHAFVSDNWECAFQAVRRYCVKPNLTCPPADQVLAYWLWLTGDRRAFLRIARPI